MRRSLPPESVSHRSDVRPSVCLSPDVLSKLARDFYSKSYVSYISKLVYCKIHMTSAHVYIKEQANDIIDEKNSSYNTFAAFVVLMHYFEFIL